ncbi:hypothetical protein COLO4_31471 [Corchorus olitorius]|uniref:Uncharacterized protein n=1 Tax=Corchorus olitorius TaxID=93759 RepID=A0A1R3H494_9ROSI|nr:hypothetical protein COLO4_31471 [Corchorus olitorius]
MPWNKAEVSAYSSTAADLSHEEFNYIRLRSATFNPANRNNSFGLLLDVYRKKKHKKKAAEAQSSFSIGPSAAPNSMGFGQLKGQTAS